MRLSEAIRLGAMLNRQLFGSLFVKSADTGAVLATCAWGAALEAGYQPDTLCHRAAFCPACGKPYTRQVYGKPFVMLITHLNDEHRWTREQIAAWVATVEAARHPAPEDAPATHAGREAVDTTTV